MLTDVAALNRAHLLLHRHYIMQIITMKEVKSGERQKGTDRWEMWFWATSICCINHIRVGLEHKRTYGSLAPLLVFLSSLFFCWNSSTSQTSLILFRLSCPCPCLVREYSGYCVWGMMLVSARPAGALTQTTVSPMVMQLNLPALTTYDTLRCEF